MLFLWEREGKIILQLAKSLQNQECQDYNVKITEHHLFYTTE